MFCEQQIASLSKVKCLQLTVKKKKKKDLLLHAFFEKNVVRLV